MSKDVQCDRTLQSYAVRLRKYVIILLVPIAVILTAALQGLRCSHTPSLVASVGGVRGRGIAQAPVPVHSSNALLAALLGNATELAIAGGVYIYTPEQMLPSNVDTLFPISGGHAFDWLNQYALEQTMIRALQESPYVTTDPDKARLFVVPQHATLQTHYCLYALSPIPANRLHDCAANVTRDYLMPIIKHVKDSRWYKRNNGQDHLWIFPWDASWTLFPGVPDELRTNHFFGYIGPEANLIPVPVTARVSSTAEDVERSFYQAGGSVAHGATFLRVPDSGRVCTDYPEHKYLASFAGTVWPDRTYSKGLRQDLLGLYPEAKAGETKVVILDRHVTPDEYKTLLRDSIFCLSPPGWTAWSQRLYFAVATGCIPVFFSVPGFDVQLPYNDVLKWKELSVTIPEGRHMDVKAILSEIPVEEVCRMRYAVASVAPFLLWSQSPQFTLLGALHQAWKLTKPTAGAQV